MRTGLPGKAPRSVCGATTSLSASAADLEAGAGSVLLRDHLPHHRARRGPDRLCVPIVCGTVIGPAAGAVLPYQGVAIMEGHRSQRPVLRQCADREAEARLRAVRLQTTG